MENTVRGSEIREHQEYASARIVLGAYLGQARVQIQIDIGFGDAVTPPPAEVEFPTILDFRAPRLRVYPRETMVAEKFQAMVMLGIANSRMRDFYDLWTLAKRFPFEGRTLRNAIKATFARRRTALPLATPVALTPEFFDSSEKGTQWRAFLRKAGLGHEELTLAQVTALIETFLMPPTVAVSRAERFEMIWPPAGPWREIEERDRS